jgi:hypothetical protein
MHMVRLPKLLLGTAALTLVVGGSLGSARAAAIATVNVSADVATPLGTIPSAAFGLNASVYDANLLNADIPDRLRDAGVALVRWPGGTTSDVYHWQTNSITPGTYAATGQPFANYGYAAPGNTFDNFMSVVNRAGARAMITVNYGTNAAGTGPGDPAEAAGWVNYANNVKHYGVQYWEVGNEVYGDGTYGADWEPDLHAPKTPDTYGHNAAAFIQAMKAQDPTIKVGVVLTAPGNWPDMDVNGPPNWNPAVIADTCAYADIAVVHWYPQDPSFETDAGLLQAPERGTQQNGGTRSWSIAQMVGELRAEIAQYCPRRAGQWQIMVTETNSVSYNPGKQTVGLVNALFQDDAYVTWLENGVSSVDWWQLHNGPVLNTNNSPSLFGTADYGDYGVLSNGASPEPPADTAFPAYYGLQMLHRFAAGGDQMIRASSTNDLLTAHAVRRANGSLTVLVINKDPSNSYNVVFSLPGYRSFPAYLVSTYGEGSTGISTRLGLGNGPLRSVNVGPYSLTTVLFVPDPQLH